MQTKTKIAADGSDAQADVTDHVAVRIDHPLLARPLIVTAQAAPKTMTWKQAAKWAESLDLCGWSWRLPTVEEAFMIPDRSRYPAIDSAWFPDFDRKRYEWIWTSTPDADAPAGFAWYVYLGSGDSDRSLQGYRGHVRAVRAGQF